MNILVACEESQAVCKAFREKGHNAFSCDIIDCSGGHPERKATCLWLQNLPLLKPTVIVDPDIYYYTAKNGRIKSDSRWRSACKKEDRAKHRAKTFPGIAAAMAEQWG